MRITRTLRMLEEEEVRPESLRSLPKAKEHSPSTQRLWKPRKKSNWSVI